MNEKIFRLKTFEKASYCRHFEEQVIKNLKEKKINIPTYVSAGQEFIAASMATICEELNLDFVNQITPIEYKFKKSREDNTPHGLTKYGFKAQEILQLEGDNPVIINNEDEENLKLTSAHLMPVLVNAIKELKAEIDELKKG